MEQQIFQRKRWIIPKLLEFGFVYKEMEYRWCTPIINGEFSVIITVDAKGNIRGQVFDKMTQDEYLPLHNQQFNGLFVNQVRAEYEVILKEIARYCCQDVTFASNQANRLTEWILKKYKVTPDFPFEDSSYQTIGTFRHEDTRKWFAVIMNVKWDSLLKNKETQTVDIINLKILPEKAVRLREHSSVFPGFHMNHKHWISVVLNDTLEDDVIFELINGSFYLTKGGRKW